MRRVGGKRRSDSPSRRQNKVIELRSHDDVGKTVSGRIKNIGSGVHS
jgi:hypothetical protein